MACQRVVPRAAPQYIISCPAIHSAAAVVVDEIEWDGKRLAHQGFQIQLITTGKLQPGVHSKRGVLQRQRLAVTQYDMERYAVICRTQRIALREAGGLI